MTPAEHGGKLSIGALSRATGIPVETLRTWETRYGFPVPERKPSGHRLYPLASVRRLRRIAEALALGHRAGQVVPAREAELTELLRATPSVPAPPPARAPSTASDILGLVEGFDGERLTSVLLSEWARTSPLEFLEEQVAPLVREVGEAWATGRLHVRHEHFVSERLGDVLRSVRIPFEERARGPLVVLATLPGEEHALGLQMAALVLAWCGNRLVYLGTEAPVDEVAQAARDQAARAVAVSVSLAHAGRATSSGLARLRRLIPKRTHLVVGGQGAPRPRPGVEVMPTLRDLESWARTTLRA
jgi:methanogenic corrinoid protein MtbC1